jgi:hypothetical protein
MSNTITSTELAAATGTHERYVREWLEQQAAGGILGVDDAHADAFRTGDGIPYADYGTDLHKGQAEFTRPMFESLLGTEWLPAIPSRRRFDQRRARASRRKRCRGQGHIPPA